MLTAATCTVSDLFISALSYLTVAHSPFPSIPSNSTTLLAGWQDGILLGFIEGLEEGDF